MAYRCRDTWSPSDNVESSVIAEAPQSADATPEGEIDATGGSASGKPAGIDKGVLLIAAPRRYHDREHLRYVAKQPCVICGRKPSDPHHLRFMQPRALGRTGE